MITNPQTCFQLDKNGYIERQHPNYHFSVPSGWLNDPNGGIYHDGYYHIFFLHDPFSVNGTSSALIDNKELTGLNKPNRVWAHIKSVDMLNWIYLKPALTPNREKGEVKPMSGSSIKLKDNSIMLMYTSVLLKDGKLCNKQCITSTSHDCDHFEGVIDKIAIEQSSNSHMFDDGYRDPFIFEKNGNYYTLIAAISNSKPVIALFKAPFSNDLTNWEYQGILIESNLKEEYLECPKLLDFGNKQMLIYSPIAKGPRYLFGELDLDNCIFKIEKEGNVSEQNTAYATIQILSPDGKYYILSWIPGWDKHYHHPSWQGCLSIPYEVKIGKEIQFLPYPELNNHIIYSKKVKKITTPPYFKLSNTESKGKLTLVSSDNEIMHISWNKTSITIDDKKIKINKTNFDLYVDDIIWELTFDNYTKHICGCFQIAVDNITISSENEILLQKFEIFKFSFIS